MSNALDRDPLATLMPRDCDADRPWLVFYASGERIELTGHVLAMWSSKIAGFLTSEVLEGARVALALPPHWRSMVWALGIWQSGGCVLPTLLPDAVRHGPASLSPSETKTGMPAPAGHPPLNSDAEQLGPAGLSPNATAAKSASREGLPVDAAVAFTESGLLEADAQILLPRASLALRWEGEEGEELPPLVFDGVADVMPYPDRMPALSWDADTPCLDDGEQVLTRADLRALVEARAEELRTSAATGEAHRAATEADSLEAEASSNSATLEAADAASTPRAFLTRNGALADCLIDCLAAWMLGRTAVIVDAHAPEKLRTTAITQEGA